MHSGLLVGSLGEADLVTESAQLVFVDPSRMGRRRRLVRLVGYMTCWCVPCGGCAFNLSAATQRVEEQAKTRLQGVAQQTGQEVRLLLNAVV
jgi:hypothetical protein